LGGRSADVADQHFHVGYRRGQQLEDRPRPLRQVDAERGVRDALGEDRQHDEARYDEGTVADAVDSPHARADRRAEHHEVQRGRQHRGRDALHQGAEGARHLEAIDRADREYVHRRSLTRPTKMSSSELSLECRSLKSMPSSPRRFSSGAMPLSPRWASKVRTSVSPPSASSSGKPERPGGIAASGCCRCRVSCRLPSLRISSVLSSTTISRPLWITPTRSAISSASSM